MPAQARRRLKKRKKKTERGKPSFLLKQFLAVVLVILSVGFIWNIYSSWQNRVWKGKYRFTVVVATENPRVYSYSPADGQLLVMEIPGNTEVQASHGYGAWLVGNLWEFGESEGLGGELLSQTLRKSLGVPVDGWIDSRGDNLFQPRSLAFLQALKEAVLSSSVKTNLTFFDRVSLVLSASKAGLTNRREVSLLAARVIKKETLPDGVEGYTVVSEGTRPTFERLFRDTLVFQEAKTLTVVNTTQKSGIAGEVARLAAILGVRVVSTDTRSAFVRDCAIKGDKDNLSSFSAQRLSQLLGCKRQEGETRTQLELLLGEGFAKRF